MMYFSHLNKLNIFFQGKKASIIILHEIKSELIQSCCDCLGQVGYKGTK